MSNAPFVMILASLLALAGCASRPATDPAEIFVVDPPKPPAIQAALFAGGSIAVRWSGQEVTASTKYSQPNAGWKLTTSQGQARWISSGSDTATLDSPAYGFKRSMQVLSDHILVKDTLSNPTGSNVGVHLFHRALGDGSPRETRLGGLESSKSVRNAFNPSIFASYGSTGIGLLAEDDVFRVHALLGVDQGAPMLSDDQLVLAAGKSVTLEWSLYPTGSGGYWEFVNAVRRNWGTNRTINGPFAFTAGFGDAAFTSRDVAGLGKWARDRNLKYIVGGMPKNSDGTYAHGTAGGHSDYWIRNEKSWQTKLRAGDPGAKTLSYFHMQISTESAGESKYSDSRMKDEGGQTVVYPNKERLPLFVPTPTNGYGKALMSFLNSMTGQIGVDGIYWDEMSGSYGAYNYNGPWDGVTGVLDPRSKVLTDTRSAVPLQLLPMSKKIVDWAESKNLMIIANSMSRTRTLMDEPFLRFQETLGNFDKMANTHLQWPVGLANNNKEETAADSVQQVVSMLDRGGVYYGFRYVRAASPWNFSSVLYPITPVELREGVVIGKERILTNRSGTFGFPDGSKAQVVVVDRDGSKDSNPSVSEVQVSGKRAYRVTVESGQFAVIIKA